MEDIWPKVVAVGPTAEFIVIGRNPPARLVNAAQKKGFRWLFTGFVDDVKPYVRAAHVCVIPLRVGGGTRLKVYESMAMGCPRFHGDRRRRLTRGVRRALRTCRYPKRIRRCDLAIA